MSERSAGEPGEIIQLDIGGWLSGPMLDPASAIAVAVPCQVHGVPAGTPCPLITAGACMARHAAAGEGR